MSAEPQQFRCYVWPEINPERQRAEALAGEIIELSAHVNAAQYRLLELIARFDRDELWGWFGVANCVQWLNWQCGMGSTAAREHVRVARALEKLPKTSAAFARGEISYSKVRAITRIAIPESEETLVMIARHGTAAHLERLVAKYRWVERIEAAAEANAQRRKRFVHYSYDDDGMFVIAARLPAEVGELVRKALDAAVEDLYQDGVGGRGGEHAERNASAEASLRSGPGVSAEASAAAQCGVEPIDAAAHAERPATSEPVGAIETESNVSAEAPGPTPYRTPGGHAVVEEFEGQDWVETLGARQADALRLLAETYLTVGAKHVDTTTDRYQVVVHIDQALLASGPMRSGSGGSDRRAPGTGESSTKDAGCPFPGGAPHSTRPLFDRCELETGRALALETVRRLACDSALVGMIDGANGEPLSVGRKTRAIPPALRRALRARDGGCRFPGCDRTRFTHGHHVTHWADGGETKLSNLVTLCKFHHDLVHDGGFGVEVTDDGGFVFLRPDGQRLPDNGRLSSATLEALATAAAEGTVTLCELNRRQGLSIDAQTAACRWSGERMDYHMAVGGLFWDRDHARGTAMAS